MSINSQLLNGAAANLNIKGATNNLVLVAAGSVAMAVLAPSITVVAIAGVLATDLCYATCTGSGATVANLLNAVSCVPAANQITLTQTVATDATTVCYAVYRLV
jgi:hypothetical protein|nr:MAG: hypothetical protein [Lake Baikal virophage 2]